MDPLDVVKCAESRGAAAVVWVNKIDQVVALGPEHSKALLLLRQNCPDGSFNPICIPTFSLASSAGADMYSYVNW